MRFPRVAALAGLLVSFTAAPTIAAPPGFAFLDIPTGARAASLGGAYASLAGGPDALFWNPAGLPGPRGLELAGGHSELMEKLRHDYVAVGGPLWGGGVAVSLRALYSEAIDERDELGNLIGTFGAHDLEFALGYGRRTTGGLSLGGSAAVVRERISNLAATTYDFGLGASWEPSSVPGARVSVAAQNLGPSARYTIDGVDGEPVALPASVQSGVSYQAGVGSRFTVRGAAETRLTRGRNALGLMGAELADLGGASLRLGIRLNDNASMLSFGAGYALPTVRLDYAFVPLRLDLGDTHRFAFTARF